MPGYTSHGVPSTRSLSTEIQKPIGCAHRIGLIDPAVVVRDCLCPQRPRRQNLFPAVRVCAASPLSLRGVWNNLHRNKWWWIGCTGTVSCLLPSSLHAKTNSPSGPRVGATLCGPPRSLMVDGCIHPDSRHQEKAARYLLRLAPPPRCRQNATQLTHTIILF
jgi:hypothetical protein